MEATLTKNNVQVIQKVFADFQNGNIPAIVDACSNEIIWGGYKNPHIPFSGLYYGKEGVMEFFSRVADTINITAFEPREFISDGDDVVAIGRHSGSVKSTGKTFDHDWCFRFHVKNGRILKFVSFADTYEVATAFKE
ncbi:MAG TPA: nuclear transport factor 2 family protein [Flavisolibacter sp.]|nr:nuclear transport factor 2 family protein [Flavisolibacter sp.]